MPSYIRVTIQPESGDIEVDKGIGYKSIDFKTNGLSTGAVLFLNDTTGAELKAALQELFPDDK